MVNLLNIPENFSQLSTTKGIMLARYELYEPLYCGLPTSLMSLPSPKLKAILTQPTSEPATSLTGQKLAKSLLMTPSS